MRRKFPESKRCCGVFVLVAFFLFAADFLQCSGNFRRNALRQKFPPQEVLGIDVGLNSRKTGGRRGKTAQGFRDLDDLRAMCCFRWPCAGIVAAVCREASRLRCKSIGIRVSGVVVLSMGPINHLLQPSLLVKTLQ